MNVSVLSSQPSGNYFQNYSNEFDWNDLASAHNLPQDYSDMTSFFTNNAIRDISSNINSEHFDFSNIEHDNSTQTPDYFESLGSQSSTVSIDNLVSNSNLVTMGAGAAVNYGINAITNINNQENLVSATQGNGPNGHAFDAMTHAEQVNNVNDSFKTAEELEVSAGSMFGPEGLAIGIAAAGVTAGINYTMGSSNENTTNSVSGNQVNAVNQL